MCGGVANVRDRGGGQADSRLEKQQSHGTAGGRNKMCGWHSGEWRANFEGGCCCCCCFGKGAEGWLDMALAWGTSLRRDALGEPDPAMAT